MTERKLSGISAVEQLPGTALNQHGLGFDDHALAQAQSPPYEDRFEVLASTPPECFCLSDGSMLVCWFMSVNVGEMGGPVC